MTNRERDSKISVPKRRPLKYERPKLEKFGKISNLTGGVGGTKFDPGHNQFTKMGGA